MTRPSLARTESWIARIAGLFGSAMREARASYQRALYGTGTNLWRSINSWESSRQLPQENLEYPDAYRLVGHVRFAVSLIMETVSSLELRFYKRQRNGKLVEIEREPGNPRNPKELFDTANPEYSGYDLKEQLVGSELVHGNAFLELEFGGSNIPRALWARNPLDVKLANNGRGFVIGTGPSARNVSSADLVQFRLWNPAFGWLGPSPLAALEQTYGGKRDLERWLRTFFAKGGRVAGSYTSERGGVNDPDKKALEEYYARNSTPERFPVPLVLTGQLKHEREGLTIDEMRIDDMDLVMLHNVLRVYKIPSAYANIMDGAGMNSDVFATAKMQFFEQAVEPFCTRMESTLDEKVLGLDYWGLNVVARFDKSTIDAYQIRRLNMAKAYTTITGGPVLTRAEARDEMGLEPLATLGDELLVPVTMLTDEQAQQKLDTAAQPPPPAQDGAAAPEPARAANIVGPMNRDASRRDRQRVRAGRLLRTHERRMERGVRRMLNRQERKAIARLREQVRTQQGSTSKRGPNEVDPYLLAELRAIDVNDLLHDEKVDTDLIERLVRAIVQESGEAAIAELGVEVAFDLARHEVMRWIDAKAVNMVTNVNATTRDRLRASLSEGTQANEGLDELIGRVRTVFENRRANAPTIARTETVGPYNYGAVQAWDQSGVVTEKEWLTAHDDRVRETHAAVDGDRVSLNGDFLVGGSVMGFPGDPRGDVSEVANCRCTMIPVVRGADEPDDVSNETIPMAEWVERELRAALRKARTVSPGAGATRARTGSHGPATAPAQRDSQNGHGPSVADVFGGRK